MTAAESMEAGVDFLSGLMRSHGFAYAGTAIGKGSGGAFASGEFRRGDRVLELHFRHSLGLVKYHARDVELSHEDYMWSVLGERYAGHYPGFSSDAMDGFRHLLLDLEQYGSSFLARSDAEFAKHAEHAAALKKSSRRFP